MSARTSVVIAVHDGERFLGAAIESVLRQTRAVDEILVCDDGSSDGSVELARGYGERVRLLRQANRGVAAARNRALRAASGELIAFLDQDDEWEPEHLGVLAGRLERDTSLGLVYADSRVVDSLGRAYGLRSDFLDMRSGQVFLDLLRGNFVPIETLLVRRRALDEVGLFDEQLRYLEDWELCLRLAHEHAVGFCPEALARYRIHGKNLSWKKEAILREHVAVLEDLLAGSARLALRSPLSPDQARLARVQLAARQADLACHLLTRDLAPEAREWYQKSRRLAPWLSTCKYLCGRSLHHLARTPFLALMRRVQESRPLYGVAPLGEPERLEASESMPPAFPLEAYQADSPRGDTA